MRPRLPNLAAVQPRLEAVTRRGIYSNFGPQVVELEARYATWLGVEPEQVVSAANATLAIAGAVAATGCGRWIVPSFTFTASAAAARIAGPEMRFGDIDAGSWWLDAAEVSEGDAVMSVAPFGDEIHLETWLQHDTVVLDAAASLGTQPDLSGLHRRWCTVFSLHATKVLGAGEGGIAVFGSPYAARRFRMWSNFGFFGTRESQLVGLNAKMSEMQAAYALAALDGWEEERVEWITARDLVLQVGDELDLVTFAASRTGITPYWIAVFPSAATTDLVERVLNEHGVGTRRWWSRGCHLMPAYADVPHGPLAVTEDVAGRYLGLPLYRGLSEEDAAQIAAALLDARQQSDSW